MDLGTVGQLLIFCGSLCKAKKSTGLGREGQREEGGRERKGGKKEGREEKKGRKEYRKEDLSSTHSWNNMLLSQILFVGFVPKS